VRPDARFGYPPTDGSIFAAGFDLLLRPADLSEFDIDDATSIANRAALPVDDRPDKPAFDFAVLSRTMRRLFKYQLNSVHPFGTNERPPKHCFRPASPISRSR